jgi:hypothetical protein
MNIDPRTLPRLLLAVLAFAVLAVWLWGGQ